MGPAGQVLQRHSVGALRDQPAESPDMIIIELGEQRQPDELDTGDEGQQDSGVLGGRWHPGRTQLVGGRRQQRPDRLAHFVGSAPTRLSRSATSACCRAVTKAARSPLRTWSRLYALKPIRWSEIRFSGKL